MARRKLIALAASLLAHAGAALALAAVGAFRTTPPQLHLPDGMALGAALYIPADEPAEPAPPPQFEAPADLLQEIGLVQLPPVPPPATHATEVPSPTIEVTVAPTEPPDPAHDIVPDLRTALEIGRRELAETRSQLTAVRQDLAALLASATRTISALTLATPAPSSAAPGSSRPGIDRGPALANGNSPPVYPESARRNRQAGTVLVHVTIETDGSVSTSTVARSSGFTLLDDAALTAVASWRFTPATSAGTPISGEADVPVHFVLRR